MRKDDQCQDSAQTETEPECPLLAAIKEARTPSSDMANVMTLLEHPGAQETAKQVREFLRAHETGWSGEPKTPIPSAMVPPPI